MKIKFTDKIDKNDWWVEEYPSLKSITLEVKEGCDLIILLDCEKCKKEFETLDEADVALGICKDCQKNN